MMTRRRFLLLNLVLVLGLSSQAEAASNPLPLIVQIPRTISIDRIAATLGGTVVDSIPGANTYLLNVPPGPLLFTLSALGIQWEQNKTVSLPRFGQRQLVRVPGAAAADWYKLQPALELINVRKAWPFSTGRAIVVADINSQVDHAHPALVGHLTSGYDFLGGPGLPAVLDQSDVGLLQSDAAFLEQSDAAFLEQSDAAFLEQSNPAYLDSLNPAFNHGSLSAGIIAAIAPDSLIMPLRVFGDDGQSDLFTLAKAIRFAVDHGAQIINLNFGVLYPSVTIRGAVQFAQAAKVVLVAPAGNNHTSQPMYPAAFNGVISAAATDLSDTLASFSNYGSNVFAAAPGVDIISVFRGGYYSIASGTSLSAATVAGTAALVRSLRANGVSDSIAQTALNIDSRNPAYQNQLGHGRINTFGAVTLSLAPTTTSINAPAVTYNASGIVTVTVTSPAGAPAGNVLLTIDGGTVMSAALNNSAATFTIKGLNAGDHALTASYGAQGGFAASSATGWLHVNPRPITVTADPKSKTYGTVDPILTYQIGNGSLVNGDSFTGHLTRAAGENVGTYPIQQGTLALGPNYTQTYVGANLTITPAPTTTGVTSATNPSDDATRATFIVTVSTVAPSVGTPAGGIQLYDGATQIGTSTLTNGSSAITVPPLTAGIHSISATYLASPNFFGSTSAPISQTVSAMTPTGKNVTAKFMAGPVTVGMVYSNVATAGKTTLSSTPVVSGTLPRGYFTLPGVKLAFDLTTTAEFTGSVTITYTLPTTVDLTTFSKLRILHDVDGILIDQTILPPRVPAPNFATHSLSARVTSLSRFGIASYALGPRSTLDNLLSTLQKLTGTKDDDERIQAAVSDLRKALAPSLWVDQSETTVQQKTGATVFDEIKDAIKQLEELVDNIGEHHDQSSSDKLTPLLQNTVPAIIQNLVTVARDLASAAIDSPVTTLVRDLTEAKNPLAKGDEAQLNDQTQSAIERYRDAWMFASNSVVKGMARVHKSRG